MVPLLNLAFWFCCVVYPAFSNSRCVEGGRTDFCLDIVSPGTLNDGQVSLRYMGPSFDMAFERMHQAFPDFNMTHTYLYSETLTKSCYDLEDNVQLLLSSWYYRRSRYKKCATAIITPGCFEGYRLNQMAAGWNVPLISSSSVDITLSNPRFSPTWVTTTPYPGTKLKDLYIGLLRQFNWTTVFMLTDVGPNTAHKAGADKLQFVFKSTEIRASHFLFNSSTNVNYTYAPILAQFRDVSRVMLFFGFMPHLRRLLIEASGMNMTNREYVYVTIVLSDLELSDSDWKGGTDADNEVARRAFSSVLQIVTIVLGRGNSQYMAVKPEYDRRFGAPPWATNRTNELIPAIHMWMAAYAAIQMFEQILNETVTSGQLSDMYDGAAVKRRLVDRTFATDIGPISLDDDGNRIPTAVIRFFNTSSMNFVVSHSSTVRNREFAWKKVTPIEWYGGWDLPLNEPYCGYKGLRPECHVLQGSQSITIAIVVALVALTLIILILARVVYLRLALSAALGDTWWKGTMDEVSFEVSEETRRASVASGDSQRRRPSFVPRRSSAPEKDAVIESFSEEYLSSWVEGEGRPAMFRGESVWVQAVRMAKVPKLTNRLLIYFSELNKIRHVNISRMKAFYPLVSHLVFIRPFYYKGSLSDLLSTMNAPSWEYRGFLLSNVIQGLEFIHHSFLKLHGRLRSGVCMIDNRLNLQISEVEYTGTVQQMFGRSHNISGVSSNDEFAFWQAPEFLRHPSLPLTQKGDIYSLSIIMQEITTWNSPYSVHMQMANASGYVLTPKMITQNVTEETEILFRPTDARHPACSGGLAALIEACWAAQPEERPDIKTVRALLERSEGVDKRTYAEKVLDQMQRNAVELEEIVEARTEDLQAERERCDQLLGEMLPAPVVRELRNGGIVEPENFEEVTICFSDVVGFNDFVSSTEPFSVVEFLSLMYNKFDAALSDYDVYKVETINDSYVVASGLPIRNANRHAREIPLMALHLLDLFQGFDKNETLQVRFGINTGSVAGCVVGIRAPRYCLFGDAMNMASRMMSNSKALSIQLTSKTASYIMDDPCFALTCRGTISIKGKGDVTTYWLNHGPVSHNRILHAVARRHSFARRGM
ncbi:Atrial natriuretic peptide receptor 2 [Hypsibius exemplaris]|uniref:guanylate cyclase n=1 Tax=Hypsibius exemplaris TaxID=2072580 RepID=A0A1W0WI75_HYPEX|nr:Atrial natriuretic peptide receptor 2 [Hypsibius exemplaris]